MKLVDIVNSVGSLNELGNMEFSAYISFRISYNMGEISPIVEKFNKEKEKIVGKYGIEDVNIQGKFEIPSKDREEFKKNMDKLSEEDIVLDLKSITLEELDNEGVKLKPVMIMSLMKINVIVE